MNNIRIETLAARLGQELLSGYQGRIQNFKVEGVH